MSAARTVKRRAATAPALTIITPPTPAPAPTPAKVRRPRAPRDKQTRKAAAAMQEQRDQALRAGDLGAMLHAEAASLPLLTDAQELTLARLAHDADPEVAAAARESLISHNLRLVEKAAVFYRRTSRMEYVDLCAAGMFGLFTAVERFDAARGWRFSTYAWWWIRQSITREQDDHASAVRLPAYLRHRDRFARRLSARMALETGREPTNEELAAQINALRARGEYFAWGYDPAKTITAESLRAARTVTTGVLSLDRPPTAILAQHHPTTGSDPHHEAETAYANTVADPRAEEALAAVEDEEERDGVQRLLDELRDRGVVSAREVLVLDYRYRQTSPTGKPFTLEEIGARLGITRERVRQIEAEALKKLRGALAARGVTSMATWRGEGASSGERGERRGG